MDGRYSVCFENPSGSIQKVSFNFLGQDPSTTNSEGKTYYHEFNQFKILLADKAEKPDQLQIELQELNSGLKYIQNEQDYMLQRGKIHRQSTKIFHWKLLIFTFRFSRPKIEF